MEPLKMYFPPSEYKKVIKVSAKCYIKQALETIESTLSVKEKKWFLEHPQFKHFFHMGKNTKHKWMGMWMLIVRSASIQKKMEMWFVVNGVPIRYSMRELGLISGLYCHVYPKNYERIGSLSFISKYFEEGKKITYEDVANQMKKMKNKPSVDRLKMVVLYFLSSVIIGSRKSGEGAPSVESFFLRAVDDLKKCETFPWGRMAFEHNMKDISWFLESSEGVVGSSWVLPSFAIPMELLAFEAIPVLKNHFREKVVGADDACPRMCKMKYKCRGGTKYFSISEMNAKLGRTKDIESILKATPAEVPFLNHVMHKDRDRWDDKDDVVVDGWTKILVKKKKSILFEELYEKDFSARTSVVEPDSIPNAPPAVAPTVEAPRIEAPRIEAHQVEVLLNEAKDTFFFAINNIEKKIDSLANRITPLEEDVKKLKMCIGMNVDVVEKEREKDGEELKKDGEEGEKEDDKAGNSGEKKDGTEGEQGEQGEKGEKGEKEDERVEKGEKEDEHSIQDDAQGESCEKEKDEQSMGDDGGDGTVKAVEGVAAEKEELKQKSPRKKTKKRKAQEQVRSPIVTRTKREG